MKPPDDAGIVQEERAKKSKGYRYGLIPGQSEIRVCEKYGWVKLSDDVWCRIDLQDVHVISGKRWSILNGPNTSYAIYQKGSCTYLMHRMLTGAEKYSLIDHIDCNGLNNVRENLRRCNKSQNGMNRDRPRSNTSGFKGVWFDRRRKKWCAEITKNYKKTFLGRFDTAEEAYAAYTKAGKLLQQEFYHSH